MSKSIYKITTCSFIIVILIILTGYTSFNQDFNSQNMNLYSIYDETYIEEGAKNKYIEIKYPIILGLNNDDTQQLINAQIKNKAFEIIDDFSSLENMDIRTKYSIRLSNSKILSIMYNASSFHSSQAYPLIRNNMLNVDIKSGRILTFNDILKVDEEFISLFLNKFNNISKYSSNEDEQMVNEYIAEMITYDMFISNIEGSFPEIGVYLTEDELVISIAVPYSLGSFVLYSAKYSGISEYMKFEIN